MSLRERIIDRLCERVGPEQYRRYFKGSVALECEGRAVTVVTGSAFHAERLRRRFEAPLRDAAAHELRRMDAALDDRGVRVDFSVDASMSIGATPLTALPGPDSASPMGIDGAQAPARPRGRDADAAPPAPASSPRVVTISPPRRRRARGFASPGQRLEDFVVVRSNELAYHAAQRLIEPECPVGFSPLFIHGPCGLGKTHLLRGLADAFARANPGARVCFTTGEAFTNAFITALQRRKLDAFRQKHRDVDLLCIDDIHFLSNKSATQTEFLHTFNAIGLEGARVALVSDEHPARVQQFSKELVSRFVSGMIVRIERPSRDMRVEIAKTLAARRGLRFEEGALRALAARCVDSVREIESALTRVQALAQLAPEMAERDGVVGIRAVDAALETTEPERPARPVPVELIVDHVCEALRVDVSELMGKSRHKRVVLARSVAAALARRMTTSSYPEIARALGRPNHSTVVTACKRLEAQVAQGEHCGAGPDLDGVSVSELIERLRRDIVRRARSA